MLLHNTTTVISLRMGLSLSESGTIDIVAQRGGGGGGGGTI